MSDRKDGLIHVYTGDGKGKTTAALGMALRAAGHGWHTYVAQFMKGQEVGELAAAVLLICDWRARVRHRQVYRDIEVRIKALGDEQ